MLLMQKTGITQISAKRNCLRRQPRRVLCYKKHAKCTCTCDHDLNEYMRGHKESWRKMQRSTTKELNQLHQLILSKDMTH